VVDLRPERDAGRDPLREIRIGRMRALERFGRSAYVRKFRAAIAETAPIVNEDREKASLSISKFTKQPIELVKATLPPLSNPELKAEHLAWWIEIMSSQRMLQTPLDLNKLILS
jgi:NitT/TauT family transport system substrate-binding protein